jgi:hypothetical protein
VSRRGGIEPHVRTHYAYNPEPGVIGFLCEHVAPAPVEAMREMAFGRRPGFTWTFDRRSVGCADCRLACFTPAAIPGKGKP